ncbi:MAG: hypothetical protein NTY12_03510 [Candidatus Falkowbacteria bacterium]|nr:hypothetical protein [Candidatus Falkowbacteria bacterium]
MIVLISDMNEGMVEVIAKFIGIIAQKDSPITKESVDDFIMSKTHYDVIIDYSLAPELTQEVRQDTGFHSFSTLFEGVENKCGIVHAKMKIFDDLGRFDELKYRHATSLEGAYFKQAYGKNNVIAMGSSEKVDHQIYYLVTKDGKFSMTCMGSEKEFVILGVER